MSSEARGAPGPLLLAFILAAGPAAWMVRLTVSSALVPVACRHDAVYVLHLVTLLTAGVTAAAIVLSHRLRRASAGPGEIAGGAAGWVGFVAVVCLLLNVISLALIGLESSANFAVDPCR